MNVDDRREADAGLGSILDSAARLARIGSRAYAWGVQRGVRRQLLFLLVFCFAGCGRDREAREWRPTDHQPPSAETGESDTGAEEEPADIPAAASALYRASCAGCHGVDGRGGGPAAPPGANVPDIAAASVQDALSDEQIARVILEGRGMMPAFGSQINDRGIAALVAHVRTLRAE